MTSTTKYEDDVVAWAWEQAKLLREGRFDLLDIPHLAKEIEDLGNSEQRELANRMALLLAHLLKWKSSPDAAERAGRSRSATSAGASLVETPSLRPKLDDPDWCAGAWDDATGHVAAATGLADFPEVCPWAPEQVLSQEWPPE
jgi:hypothetical protein